MRKSGKGKVVFIALLFLSFTMVLAMTSFAARPVVKAGLRMVRVTVQNVDTAKGTVILKDDRGNTTTLNLRGKVKDLKALKAGDVLALELYRSVVIDLIPNGMKPPKEALSPVDLAPQGDKPGFKNVKVLTYKVKVLTIDRDKRIVTLKTSGGTFTLNVCKRAKYFEKVKKGDDVQALVTDPMILSIRKLEKK